MKIRRSMLLAPLASLWLGCSDDGTTATESVGPTNTAADETTSALATATTEEEPTTTVPTTAPTGPTTGAESLCGDGVVDPGEACDDGDGDDGDACTNACTLAECGDGIVGPGEACDDGAENGPGQPCSETCQTTAAVCGDGQLDPGEQCDDGPDNADINSCTTECAHNICGDGKVGPGEGCDDGNEIDDDTCSNACALTSCGDGVLAPTEQCDDGNIDNTDACTIACTQATCSDGFVQRGVGEQCDDGPDNADDAVCTTACQAAVCGDGHVWASGGEACDSGAENGPGKACNAGCQLNTCGDGDPGPDEPCDDGNLAPGDGCSAACQLEGCGNGALDPGEQCDDGQDGDPDDGCTDACKLPACGDGLVQPSLAEQCDLGGANSNSGACTLACKHAVCGDGLVEAQTEQCDNGPNNGPGKACKAGCKLNVCGDGDAGPGEACDDGNANNVDGCTNVCSLATCGDGFVQPGEQCDQGASNGPGKACKGNCTTNSCGDGDKGPGEACDDGNAVDGDGCSATCQLGQQVLQVVMSEYHTCALLSGGLVKCWGHNHEGMLGTHVLGSIGDMPGEVSPAMPAVDLGTGVKATALAAGFYHTCAVVTGNLVKCWGDGTFGALGLGDKEDRGDDPNEMGDFLPYVDLGAGVKVSALAAGESHTCALLTDGGVKCWGTGGRLGLGDMMTRGTAALHMGDNLPRVDLGTGKKALSISAGYFHTCALLDDSTIKCWGGNNAGNLGVEAQDNRGDKPGQMGDNLPAVKLGVGKVPIGVTAGDEHTCALLAGGLVKCWGLLVGKSAGLAPGTMGDFLPVVNLGQGKFARKVVAGKKMTCVNLTDDGVKCWGEYLLGFTGQDIGDVPAEMGDALPLVNLGAGQAAKDIFSQRFVTCVRLDAGGLKCWGSNKWAQLGLGDKVNRGDTNASMGDNLPFVDL